MDAMTDRIRQYGRVSQPTPDRSEPTFGPGGRWDGIRAHLVAHHDASKEQVAWGS